MLTGELQTERATANAVSAFALANFVRTDLAKLDHLISTTHELFRATSNALEITAGAKAVEQEIARTTSIAG